MSGELIEKITPKEVLLRVNLNRGSFLALKNNRPLVSNKANARSIVHKLPHVVFIGNDLIIEDSLFHESDFYPVVDNFLKVPFAFQDKSDIRHLHIPVSISVDMLPVVVHYYHKPSIVGTLSEGTKGALYFVAQVENNQVELLELKVRFPHARLVLFENEKDIFVNQKQDDLTQGSFAKMRVTDIANEKEVKLLSRNPVFAARIYLRQMEWEKIKSLPFYFLLQESDIETILVFLRVMKEKESTDEQLMQESARLSEVTEYYKILKPFFSFDEFKVQEFFDEGVKEFELLQFLRKIFHAQIELLKNFPNRKKENFFIHNLNKIDEISPKE